MVSNTPTFFALLASTVGAYAASASIGLPPELFSPLIAQKIATIAAAIPSPMMYPQYTDRVEGVWQYFKPDEWTTGFFPATLYAMHQRAQLCPSTNSGDAAQWLQLGREWSTAEVPLEQTNTLGHDVGFVSYPFMLELAVDPDNTTAQAAVNAFAADLAARFDPIVGCTRSWDTADPTDFQVIIDNMMNLQVLFASYNLTKNQTLVDIAISHANKTMENHIRPDGGSFHVVEYNATTGAVVARFTSQGYSNSSTWSRGEAWGIYGFSNMFKHTGHIDYLNTARKMAAYWIENTPSDGIIPWDFNAPLVPPRPADSSAAMIAVNGFLLLAEQELSVYNLVGAATYVAEAIRMLRLNTELAWRPQWQSLLANGTVNNPEHNNLTGIVYGDYFFVTAGNQLVEMGLASC
ncbi:glycoside hydrolase family 88 protein [Gelatoporia subvermispora B]|uniref:Glycoside hydrolase family 88 protein n=1 Tax=Ceriporiopsis subvermispora (strain B) TaxID=914234 RepID=M2QQH8_CERS8|nr:glycoside hydrolase family 88 protein [Gelatoporia subvermispora B]